jgi:hypothetical protein
MEFGIAALYNVCISYACVLDKTDLGAFPVRAVMNTTMNLPSSIKDGVSLPAERASLSAQERPASTVITFKTILPIRVTAWSKARTVFYSSKSVIMRSISAQGMD